MTVILTFASNVFNGKCPQQMVENGYIYLLHYSSMTQIFETCVAAAVSNSWLSVVTHNTRVTRSDSCS
jgi:hypothetical protein